MSMDKISFGNNQQIDFTKLKSGISNKNIEKNSQLDLIFKKYDANQNGILEKDEINKFITDVKVTSGDENLSAKEAKKFLKQMNLGNLNGEDLQKFLEYVQVEADKIEVANETENGISITYKKDDEGNVKTDNYEYTNNNETKLKSSTTTNSNGTKSLTTLYNDNGDPIGYIEKSGSNGAQTTTTLDAKNRPIKSEVQKNGGVVTTTYEYADENSTTPTKIITKNPDGSETTEENGVKTTKMNDAKGTVIIEKNGVKTTTTNDGTTIIENGNTTTKTLPGGRIITTTIDENNNKTITVQNDKNSKPVTLKYDDKGNILSNAKSGESFVATAKRLGIEKDTPEFKKFQQLNEMAAKKGYFPVGGEVKIPQGLEDKINVEGLNVDVKAEKAKFTQAQLAKIDVSKYEGQTKTIKLENNATYWQLAIDSLKEEGVEKPTNAQISQRTLELQKLNGNKPLTKGTEITTIGKPEEVEEIEEVETNTDTDVESDYDTHIEDIIDMDNIDFNYLMGQVKSKSGSATSQKGADVASSLYEDINQIGTGKDFDKHIQEITSDNVLDVLAGYKAKSPSESLIEAIFDEVGMPLSKKASSVKHIKDMLVKTADTNNVEVKILTEEFSKAFDEALSGILVKVGYIDTSKLDELIDEYVKRLNDMKTLQNAAEEKIETEVFTEIPNDYKLEFEGIIADSRGGKDIWGNGKIDSPAVQKTGNCWAHAGINAIVATPYGKEMINNLITKKDGVIAVRIPEAQSKGLPKPKGDGIYTFVETDIAVGALSQSVGDGDVTAFMLAINKYFEEIGEKADSSGNNMDGNKAYRLFEIITGSKDKSLFSFATASKGVSTKAFNGKDLPSMDDKNYNALKEILNSGKGAIQIDLKLTGNNVDNAQLLSMNYELSSDNETPFISEGHAYAIQKMDDNNVYLQESNNPDKIIMIPKDTFIKIVGVVSLLKY